MHGKRKSCQTGGGIDTVSMRQKETDIQVRWQRWIINFLTDIGSYCLHVQFYVPVMKLWFYDQMQWKPRMCCILTYRVCAMHAHIHSVLCVYRIHLCFSPCYFIVFYYFLTRNSDRSFRFCFALYDVVFALLHPVHHSSYPWCPVPHLCAVPNKALINLPYLLLFCCLPVARQRLHSLYACPPPFPRLHRSFLCSRANLSCIGPSDSWVGLGTLAQLLELINASEFDLAISCSFFMSCFFFPPVCLSDNDKLGDLVSVTPGAVSAWSAGCGERPTCWVTLNRCEALCYLYSVCKQYCR